MTPAYFLLLLLIGGAFGALISLYLAPHRRFAIKLWLAHLVAIVSVLIVEQGAYLYEVDIQAYHSGAALRLLPLLLLVFGGLYIGSAVHRFVAGRPDLDLSLALRMRKPPFWLLWGAIGIIFLYAANLLLGGPIPAFSSVSRHDFWAQSAAFPLLGQVFGEIGIVATMVFGYVLATTRRRRARALAIMGVALQVAVVAGMGHKFGAFGEIALFLVLPSLINLRVEGLGRVLFRYLPAIGMAGAGILFLVLNQYSTYSLSEAFGGPLGLAIYRATILQGQLWWTIDQHLINQVDYWQNLFALRGDVIDGMASVMREFGRPGTQAAIDRGVRFTMGFPGTFLYGFGPVLGVAAVVLAGALVGWASGAAYWNLMRRRPIEYIGWCYMLIWTHNLATQGSLIILLNFKTGLILAMLLVMAVARIKRPVSTTFAAPGEF